MKTQFTGPDAARFAARERVTDRPVLLVGFQKQSNLGLGYLASVLRAFGYRVIIADVTAAPEDLARIATTERPLLVGFSLIFQFYIRKYRAQVRALRAAGYDGHITMGGHFPSLNPPAALAEVPELDSVCQYEGELTLLDLADALSTGGDPRAIAGLIHAGEAAPSCGGTRSLLHDLDDLPWPAREVEPRAILGQRSASLLASRGCARTCPFCSIHTFYRSAPGKVVRLRAPEKVVEEMAYLHHDEGISVFLFQDDDFPIFGPNWKKWARRLIGEIKAAGLADRIAWKINCRADAVDPELLLEMKAAGLFLVYMGLESGDSGALDVLGKGVSAEQNLAAVRTLKRIGLRFEYGFMLLDPSSSFASIRANLDFLRKVTGDGSVAATFCRMLPYDGTPIKDRLVAEGRFRGDVCDPDYAFLDDRLDGFNADMNRLLNVSGWIHGTAALSPSLNWAWDEFAVLARFFPALAGLESYRRALARLTAAANRVVLGAMDTLASHHETGSAAPDEAQLTETARDLNQRLLNLRNAFVFRHQEKILAGASLAAAAQA